MKSNADGAIDSTMVRKDMAEGVVAVPVRKLEVNTRTVLARELSVPALLVFNDAISDFFSS